MSASTQPHDATNQPSPVVIPLHNQSSSSSGGLPEWAMIELNGELVAPATESTDKENPACGSALYAEDQVELGSVKFVDNSPVMILGTHELKGKVEALKQPFCVLEKDDNVAHVVPCEWHGDA